MNAARQEDDELNSFEHAFIRAVLEYRRVQGDPTTPQLREAFEIMAAYSQQRSDNPPADGTEEWLERLPEDEHATLVVRAFLEFGATKPTDTEWHSVHRAVYGPLLCAACN